MRTTLLHPVATAAVAPRPDATRPSHGGTFCSSRIQSFRCRHRGTPPVLPAKAVTCHASAIRKIAWSSDHACSLRNWRSFPDRASRTLSVKPQRRSSRMLLGVHGAPVCHARVVGFNALLDTLADAGGGGGPGPGGFSFARHHGPASSRVTSGAPQRGHGGSGVAVGRGGAGGGCGPRDCNCRRQDSRAARSLPAYTP